MSRRSSNIEIGFVSFVAAAALSGCNAQQAYHQDWQHCVDQNNVVVEDRLCAPNQPSRLPYPYYHWLYAPRRYYSGNVVNGGFMTPRANADIARASDGSVIQTTRGGFGSSAHGAGG